MADQKDEFTEEEVDSSGKVTTETEEVIEEEETEENQEQFLVIRGRYKYGGRTKTYGIFELIGELESTKFNYVDLGSSSNNDRIYDLFLSLDNPDFNDNLKQLVALDNSYDKVIIRELKKDLVVSEIVNLLEGEQEEDVEDIIKEKIEDEVQEGIKLELAWEIASQSDLVDVYPSRFKETENDRASEEADLDLGETEDSQSSSLSDYGSEGLGLDIDLKLKCSPVISAISGKLITSFDVDDELLVRITDNSKLDSELRDKIKTSKGLGVGKIAKIDYKEEVDRYRVLVELGDKIYGQLLVGPKVMLSHPESKADVGSSDDNSSDLGGENNEVGVLFTIVGLFIVIIVLLLMYL